MARTIASPRLDVITPSQGKMTLQPGSATTLLLPARASLGTCCDAGERQRRQNDGFQHL
jgi:hypothetical protein